MHGSLNQNFYFCTNVSDQPDYFVIWQGDDGSQIDDGQARIYPGAFTLISPFRDDDGVARCSLAAAALLYRCLRELDFIGIGYDPDDGCAGGNMHDYCETKLSNEQVAEILQSGLLPESKQLSLFSLQPKHHSQIMIIQKSLLTISTSNWKSFML